MIKINFPLLDTPLPLENATILAIEDVTVYANIVKQCYSYSEASNLKFFTEKMVSLKMTEILLITDILGFEINSPAVLKLIYADLEGQLNDKPEIKTQIENLAAKITELISYECLENELDLECDDITILELIKDLGIKIETRSDTIFKKCFEILQIYQYLSKKKLLVLVNSGAYLSKGEVEKLLEYIELSNQTVLFLEPRKLYDFPQYILDNDYVLLEDKGES